MNGQHDESPRGERLDAFLELMAENGFNDKTLDYIDYNDEVFMDAADRFLRLATIHPDPMMERELEVQGGVATVGDHSIPAVRFSIFNPLTEEGEQVVYLRRNQILYLYHLLGAVLDESDE